MNINEHILKVSDKVCIDKSLERGSRYVVTCELEVREASEVETDEESPNMVYKAKFAPGYVIKIQDAKGHIIKMKRQKGSPSQVLRRVIEERAEHKGLDQEDYYKKRMLEIIEKEKSL